MSSQSCKCNIHMGENKNSVHPIEIIGGSTLKLAKSAATPTLTPNTFHCAASICEKLYVCIVYRFSRRNIIRTLYEFSHHSISLL